MSKTWTLSLETFFATLVNTLCNMAIDQVSESVQRQERPISTLKDFKNLSLNDQDALMEREFEAARIKKTCSSGTSSLWPPLKSARYCKKQRQKNVKLRGLSPSVMLMHEAAINHHRVSTALNEFSFNTNDGSNIFDYSNVSKPFWSRRTCQEFWNDYLDCDNSLHHDLSLLSLNSTMANADHDTCPQICYTKITKSIRKLLKRTFTGAPTFSELESLVKSIGGDENSLLELSCGQVLNSSEAGVVIKLDTPFHRVWLHAICQYHGLSSQSKTVNDQRLVHIKKSTSMTIPRINLYNFLLEFIVS